MAKHLPIYRTRPNVGYTEVSYDGGETWEKWPLEDLIRETGAETVGRGPHDKPGRHRQPTNRRTVTR